MEYMEKLKASVASVRAKTGFIPKVALVLGSGLGNFASTIKQVAVVPYGEIEGFPRSTVEGHAGRFVFGHVGSLPVVAMEGRVHYYEGYPMEDVVLPVRLMKLLGAEILLLTNAAGGINYNFSAGDLMLITDHISVLAPSPLLGKNVEELGTRFPDMSQIYDLDLQDSIRRVAKKEGIPLQEGVYMQFTGPAYETPAEIRMARAMGADAAGMSTACEAVAANHMELRIAGISCITNLASGVSPERLSHNDVQETAARAAASFQALVTGFLNTLE